MMRKRSKKTDLDNENGQDQKRGNEKDCLIAVGQTQVKFKLFSFYVLKLEINIMQYRDLSPLNAVSIYFGAK